MLGTKVKLARTVIRELCGFTPYERRCMDLLGVTSCFQNPVIDVRATQFYTKHDERAYALAERLAGQREQIDG